MTMGLKGFFIFESPVGSQPIGVDDIQDIAVVTRDNLRNMAPEYVLRKWGRDGWTAGPNDPSWPEGVILAGPRWMIERFLTKLKINLSTIEWDRG